MKWIASLCSKRKYAWTTILVWVLIAGLLGAAPSANDYTVNNAEDDLPADAQSVIASEKVQAYFPDDDGLLAILVFYKEKGRWDADNWDPIVHISNWMENESGLTTIDTVVPFHRFPDQVREGFRSENGQTVILPVILKTGLEMEEINETVLAIDGYAEEILDDGELYITGPAGIASDTIAIFKNADLVLLFATIGLVLIILIIIYRSPLLALIPLLVAGLVYQVVTKVLGLLAANDILSIETQTLSIVMILLFGVTTDYSLFVFSRFREELRKKEDRFEAMSAAIRGVAEPLFFSGATVFAAMLVLLLARYGPYQNFAPTFAITIVFVLLAGLTLIPALFAVVGRRAFWPFIPKVGEETLEKSRFWGGIAAFVTKKPWLAGAIILVFLIINALNVQTISYSFNLIDSFPDNMKSRVGFELLEENYHPGDLAPVTVLVESKRGFTADNGEWDQLQQLKTRLENVPGVYRLEEPTVERLDESGRALKLQLTLQENPYDQSSLDTLDNLLDKKAELLSSSGLSTVDYQLYFAGETAKQADVRSLNERDTVLIASIVALVIFAMLIWQTKSLVAPIYMMGTILLSFLSALGLSWWIFNLFLDLEGMSYRIPLYSFVFLVALGVDYNIMLMSRIREESRFHANRQAVFRGLALTGGVISSAGIILAATFGVLTTQPIMELFLFGFIVGLGILFDTFLVRGMLVPAIAALLGDRNWWPWKLKRPAVSENVQGDNV